MKHIDPLWGVWKIEESSEELLSLLWNRKAYLSQLEMIKAEQRRREWLASRVLLQALVEAPSYIAYYPNGAPFLSSSFLHLSISHTKGYAAVLLQEHPAAGIDIEYRSGRVAKIRRRFMSPREEAGIDKEHEIEHLLLHWCAKETLFKMIGQEEVDFLRHLHVCPFPYAEEGRFTVCETRTGEGAVYPLNYLVTPDFVLTRSCNTGTVGMPASILSLPDFPCSKCL